MEAPQERGRHEPRHASKSKRDVGSCGATESSGKLGGTGTQNSRIYLKRYRKSETETGTRTRRAPKKGGFRKMAARMRRRERIKPRRCRNRARWSYKGWEEARNGMKNEAGPYYRPSGWEAKEIQIRNDFEGSARWFRGVDGVPTSPPPR